MRIRLPERLSLIDLVLWALRIAIVVGVTAGTVATLAEGTLQATDWRDLLVYGIAQGSVYALLALGYTLVYGVLFMINFAHGDVFMAGAMTAFFVADYFGETGFMNANPIVALAVIFAVSMLTSMIVAIVLERIAYRPLRRAPRLVPLITAIGASLFIANSVRGLFGERIQSYPRVDILQGRIDVLGIPVLKTQALVIVSAIILMLALYYFVERTRTGRAMRAVSEDKDTASLMGIDVDRIIVTTFAIGGLLAGAAGILYALVFNQVHWFMGFLPGIKAFTAAVLGGIGNIAGAMLGGLSLGILESVGPYLLLSGFNVSSPNQLRDVVAFTVLVLVLVFRPNGILGASEGDK
ncbi:MAG TPA: branched-chain amino acid ABC transporter permease [Candidatus Limnocylindria bacterium]|nr:branched-chain amino acid ABC transporter permease [Candidatus Limnocylindria bacterium]